MNHLPPNLRSLPIRLGTRRIGQNSEFIDCPPILDVYITCETGWTAALGKPPANNGVAYPALIDTGAESTVISEEVAAAIGAQGAHAAIVHGFGGTKTTPAVDIQIFIAAQNVVFQSRAAVSGSTADGHTFSVVLGRSFLEHCRLEVEGPTGKYALWWVE